MYAREMAQMKARLVEKDAELLGGFGSPAKLVDTQWSVPPMTPLQINPRPDAAFLERHFGFNSYPGVKSQLSDQVDRCGTHLRVSVWWYRRSSPKLQDHHT